MDSNSRFVPGEDWESDLEENVLWDVLVSALEEQIGMLGPRPLFVITARYGLWGEEPMSHAEIAERMSVTEATVRSLEALGLCQLRLSFEGGIAT